eukprot:7335427-Lingulodinium_polyedra.AAC.1
MRSGGGASNQPRRGEQPRGASVPMGTTGGLQPNAVHQNTSRRWTTGMKTGLACSRKVWQTAARSYELADEACEQPLFMLLQPQLSQPCCGGQHLHRHLHNYW